MHRAPDFNIILGTEISLRFFVMQIQHRFRLKFKMLKIVSNKYFVLYNINYNYSLFSQFFSRIVLGKIDIFMESNKKFHFYTSY